MAGTPSVRLSVAFAMIPEWIIYTCSANAVKLYAILHRHADTDGEAWPGRPRLAGLLGVTTRTLDRTMNELKSAGAMLVVPRIDEKGQHANLYILQAEPPGDTGVAPRHQNCQGSDTGVAPPVTHMSPRTRVSERDKHSLREMSPKPRSLALPPTPEEAEMIARERWPERFA